METTSKTTHGNCYFDLDHGLTTDTALPRKVPLIYEYLADPERNSSTSPNSVDGSRAHRTAGFEGMVSGGQEDTNSVEFAQAHSTVMELLSLPKQEENADLRLLYPKAKVERNCITTEQYMVVVKRFLFQLKVSGNCMVGVEHPQANARLLRRLSRELKSVSTDGWKRNCVSDPGDYEGCLGEWIDDMGMKWRDGEILEDGEETWDPDGCVYVGNGIDKYVECLHAAATELSSC